MPLFSRRSARPDDVPPLPYDPRSPEGLAARWVQWVASAGPLKNPVADETGEHAGHGQPEDVWFLAGSYGEKLSRRATLPVGRELFVPVFTMWEWPATGPQEPVEQAFGSLVVDGAVVEPDLVTTPVPFTVAGARLNGVTRTTKPVPVTVWGLWKLLPPLEPGGHELQIAGGDGHGFQVDVSYQLQVVPPVALAWD